MVIGHHDRRPLRHPAVGSGDGADRRTRLSNAFITTRKPDLDVVSAAIFPAIELSQAKSLATSPP